jgi:thioredoxin
MGGMLALVCLLMLSYVNGFHSVVSQFSRGVSLSITAGEMIELQDDDAFDELVMKSPVPVIIDFHANWCGPCKLMAPIFKELAEQYPMESIKFVKVDTDDHEETVDKFNIQGLPMFVLIKEGKVVASHSGAISRAPLKAFIDKHVNGE